MFYVRLNWNKQFGRHCDVIRKTTQLNQEIFRRSHLIKNGDLETYLYVELFDDFNFDAAASIIREAHSILEREALAIVGK